ncbi:MAG: putative multidrug ABC transporter permease YbhS [Ignavibacteria bacterium]|nr:putative multidrug ABC transporter permease YbhS [Ignavibacteria bacterium]
MHGKIFAISKKEILQILRDKRSLLILFVLPVALLVLFGYAVSLDVNNIKISILDKDESNYSRDFIRSFYGSGYFEIVSYPKSDGEVNGILDKGIAQCIVIIPFDFQKRLENREAVQVQFLIDGIDASTATIIMNYVNAVARVFSKNISGEFLLARGKDLYMPLDAEAQFWYNKDLNTTKYFIPGLIALILMIISVILTSISLVREKEFGTIEQIKVSPVSTLSLIIGKIIPYLLISLVIAASILLMGYFLFGVEVKGNYGELLLATVCYLLTTLSMGVLISTFADSQQVAFQIAMLVSQLPTVILSGFIFPIESMPQAIQLLSYITPAKYYIIVLRDILIKGVGIGVFYKEILSMLLFAFLLITLSIIKTKKAKKA